MKVICKTKFVTWIILVLTQIICLSYGLRLKLWTVQFNIWLNSPCVDIETDRCSELLIVLSRMRRILPERHCWDSERASSTLELACFSFLFLSAIDIYLSTLGSTEISIISSISARVWHAAPPVTLCCTCPVKPAWRMLSRASLVPVSGPCKQGLNMSLVLY